MNDKNKTKAQLVGELKTLHQQIRDLKAPEPNNEKVEHENLEWKRRYEIVTHTSKQVVYDHDLVTDTIVWSGNIEQVIGYKSEEMAIGIDRWISLIHPYDRETTARVFEEAKKKCELFDIEYMFKHKDGHYISLHEVGSLLTDETGKATRMIGTLQDITQRKRAEESSKRAEDALRQSEQRFRMFTEATFEGITLTERGVIIDINDQNASMHGYERGELIGKHVSELVAPESRERLAEAMQTGEQGPAEYEDVCKNGRKILVEVRSSTMQVGGRQLVLTAVRDITERKQIEKAIQRERNLLRTLIDNLPDAIYVKDAKCRKTIANLADVHNMCLTSEAEVLGKDDFDLFPKELAEGFYADDKTVIDTGKPVINREEYVIDEEGQKRWLQTTKLPLQDDKGQIIGLVGIGRDVTQRKLTEEALERERNLLRTLIDNMPEQINYKDAEGRYLINNRAHLQSINVANQEAAIGKTVFDFHPEEMAKQYYEDEMQIVHSGIAMMNKEEIVIHKDTGEKRWHLTSKIPLKNEQGKVESFIGISHDITELKLTEEALKFERNLLRTLIDNLPDAIYVKDAKCRKRIANLADVHNMGLTSEAEVLGKDDFDLFPKELAEGFYADDKAVIDSGQPVVNREEYVIDEQGQKRWLQTSKLPLLDDEDEVIGLVGIGRDVTQRKLAEEALERERNFLRTLIDNLPDMIFYKDIEGRYILDNLSHLRSIGMECQEDIIGKNSYDFNPPELAKLYLEDEMRVVETGQAMFEKEELAMHRDTGEQRWHLTSKVPLRDNKGKVTGIIGIARDITDRKKADIEREQLIADLQNAVADVKVLSGLVPICASCKKIRDDKGYWTQLEGYIQAHSQAKFSHGVCPDCMKKLYPNFTPKKTD